MDAQIGLFLSGLEKSGKADSAWISFSADNGLQRSGTKYGWKLILYPKIAKTRVHHLAADPLEMAELSENPNHSAKLRYLFTELRDLQRKNGDSLDLAGAFPGM